MTQKIKVLDTSKHKDYDVSNLTNEELLEQIDVIAKEENVVNGMLKVIERSGYEIIYKEDTSSNVEFIVRNLLFSSNVYPIIANKKVALEGSLLKVNTPKDVHAITLSGFIIKVPADRLISIVGLAINTKHQPIDTIAHITNYELPLFIGQFEIKALATNVNFKPSLEASKNKIATELRKKGIYCYYFIDVKNNDDLKKMLNTIKKQLQAAYLYCLGSSIVYTNIDTHRPLNILTTWKPPVIKVDPKYEHIVKSIAKIIAPNHLTTGIMSDITKLQLVDSFLKSISNKKDSAFNTQIEELILVNKNEADQNAQMIINIQKGLLCKTYENIIQDKLGRKRHLELSPVIALGQPDLILQSLSASERKIIEVATNMENNTYKKYTSNKCDHLQILRRLDFAKYNNERELIFQELEKFMDHKGDKHYINCKVCKLHLMCPHTLERYQLELRRAPYAELRAQLQVFASDKIVKDNIFITYCNVCGGSLYQTTAIEVNIGNVTDDNMSEYMTLVRAEAFNLCNSLTFTTMLNPGAIANLAVKFVMPFANNADADIMKAPRKKIPDAIKMKVFITIVTYAFLLYLLLLDDYKNQVSIKGKKVSGSSRAKDYTSFVFGKLMASLKNKEVVLTTEYVMTKFNTYYTMLKKFTYTNKVIYDISDSQGKDDLINHIINIDPVYNYARFIYLLTTKGSIRKNINAKEVKQEFEHILGSFNDVVNNAKTQANIYKKLYLPKSSSEDSKKRTEFLNYTSGVKNANELIKTWLGGRRMKLYIGGKKEPERTQKVAIQYSMSNVYEGYLKEAYEVYHEYVTKIAHLLTINSNDKSIVDYSSKLQRIKKAEDHLRLSRVSTKLITNLKLSSGRIQRSHVDISEVYDEDGQKHNWTIYVYEGGAELNKKQIASNIELKVGTYKDIKCSTCGILKSQSSNLDNAKVSNSLHKKVAVDQLVNFYSFRCPEKGVHTFANSKCTKCGFTYSMGASDKNSYSAKYEKAFTRDQENETTTKLVIEQDQKDSTVKIKWTHNHNIVVELSKLMKIPVEAIEKIGCVEGKRYSDIMSNKEQLESIYEDDYRNYVLEMTIRSIIINYNKIKFSVRVLSQSPYIQEVMQGFAPDVIPKLPNILPVIATDFNNDSPLVKKQYDAKDYNLYLIESFCKILTDIYKIETKVESAKISALMRKFVESEVKRIIDTEKFVSKRNIMDVEAVDDFEEVYVKDKKFDPFSYENIDYDGSNDN